MKIFRQLILIIGLFLIGEFMSKTFSLSIPGNILGMLLLLFLLCTKVIKLEMVEDISNFFLSHLAFFFIPAGVGLMTSYGLIKPNLLEIFMVCIISTILVIIITGLTVDFVINLKNKREEE